jgi:adenylate cyclase class IV
MEPKMAKNLEIKVACSDADLEALRRRLRAEGAALASLRQTDTYFAVPRGRLKLREMETDEARSAELIAYRRPDGPTSRWSDYERIAIAPGEAAGLERGLTAVCGRAGVVRKRREVAILGRTRVHLDRVEGLGSFVELETVLGGHDEAAAAAEHAAVIERLGLSRYDAVTGSYGDLIVASAGAGEQGDGKGNPA